MVFLLGGSHLARTTNWFPFQAETESYLAVGWRPSYVNESCMAFPALGDFRIKDPSDESASYRVHEFQPKLFLRNELFDMDCTDIVVGMAKGKYSRVFDAYSRDS